MPAQGKVYLFPVPLSDGARPDNCLTAAELERLLAVRYFIVENVRSARRFLRKAHRDFPIDECRFTVLDEHTRPEDVPAMLDPVADGTDCGIISEAGCPAVADPGALAVAEAHRRGITVVPMTGPSSILLSLMASGFNGQSFAFAGYLPVESGARTRVLREMERRLRREGQTQIFIETPYRNNRLIAELAKALPGDLRLCVASDITGPAESVKVMPLSEWARAKYDYAKTPTIFLLGL